MQAWATLLDLVVLLGAALVMGILAERLKQSAIVGYILSGMLVGPNVLGWVGTNEEVKILAEIGAALLLFSIGLEFSFRHLRQLGGPTLLAGIFQISLTTLSVFAIGVVFGMNLKSAVTLGVIIALSSTACVIRVLKEKSQLDSGFGRTAIGILLLQDIAVVPAIILVTTLGQDTDALEAVYSLARVLGFGLLLVGVLYVVFNRLVPRVLQFRSISKNRDLPILLATVAAIGSAIAAHSLGITPAFGAFLAGVLLAESPFSRQIRADLGALRTLLITLFFAAIGMYGDPGWTLNNLPVVIFLVLMVLLGKSLLITLITVVLRFRWSHGLATGLTISQIGEFSFVLAGVAVSAGILDLTQFRLLISVTIVTIIGTPYLITLGGAIHHKASHKIALRMKKPEKGVPLEPETATAIEKAIVIIGFGPAGQRIAESLLDAYKERLFIIDINPKNLEQAKTYGLRYQVGDASYSELLEHLPLRSTQVVVVTVPDQISASRIIHTCKATLPGTLVVSRCRHHIYSGFLYMAGADKVIDEEDQIGQAIASECLKMLGAQ